MVCGNERKKKKKKENWRNKCEENRGEGLSNSQVG